MELDVKNALVKMLLKFANDLREAVSKYVEKSSVDNLFCVYVLLMVF